MSEAIPFKKKPTDDTSDIESLWLDPGLGDGITTTSNHVIPVGKPRDFFRVNSDPQYIRRTEIYTHKPEGVIDEQHYIIGPEMRGRIPEARPATIVTCIYRDGSLRLWPICFPREGERDNDAWTSARNAAKVAMTKWVKLLWLKRAYQTRDAQPGYAPEPDFTKLPSFNELVKIAYGAHGIINDTEHPIYRELFGMAAEKAEGDGSDL
jgi:hypothetical protein